ncbi:MAG TPA: LCP family protein, partial [Marmoricola sp.]|nr:LCP family protein [Marmoricola sp.]
VILLFVVLPLVAWAVFLVTVPLISWSSIHRVDPWPAGARPAAGSGTNYLLVGTDSRRGLNAEQRKKLGLGNVAEDAGRTDTIMILHLGNGPATLLSIPRDAAFKVPGYGGPYKINSTFNSATYPGGRGLTVGGPKLLVKTLESGLHIRIDHYVEIGFGAFVNAVDAVGGVQICAPHKLNDWRADLHIKKGCQNADGATALAFSRSRHAFQLGDLARAEHQRVIVHEVGQKAKSIWTFALPWRYNAINDAAVNGLTVDNTMSIWNMISLAKGMSGVTKSCTLPLAAFTTPLPVDWSRTRQLMAYFSNDDTGSIPARLCTATGF